MKALNITLGLVLAAGTSAALPLTARAQYAATGANAAQAEQRKQLKDAEAEVGRLRADSNKIKSRIQAKYEAKEDWETTKKALKDSETAYESARKKVVAKLYATPEYKAAKDKQLKADQESQAQQASAKPDTKVLEKAQQDRLEAGIALRKLETDAMAADPKVAEAKAKVAESKKAWDALQDEVKEALQQDPDYTASQAALEQAQANLDQLKASMAQQAAAEREARRAQSQSQSQSRTPRSTSGGGYGASRGGGYGGGYGGGARR